MNLAQEQDYDSALAEIARLKDHIHELANLLMLFYDSSKDAALRERAHAAVGRIHQRINTNISNI